MRRHKTCCFPCVLHIKEHEDERTETSPASSLCAGRDREAAEEAGSQGDFPGRRSVLHQQETEGRMAEPLEDGGGEEQECAANFYWMQHNKMANFDILWLLFCHINAFFDFNGCFFPLSAHVYSWLCTRSASFAPRWTPHCSAKCPSAITASQLASIYMLDIYTYLRCALISQFDYGVFPSFLLLCVYTGRVWTSLPYKHTALRSLRLLPFVSPGWSTVALTAALADAAFRRGLLIKGHWSHDQWSWSPGR